MFSETRLNHTFSKLRKKREIGDRTIIGIFMEYKGFLRNGVTTECLREEGNEPAERERG
jgi:hypothetical protein